MHAHLRAGSALLEVLSLLIVSCAPPSPTHTPFAESADPPSSGGSPTPEVQSCQVTVPVYADTAFVATGDGPPGDPTLARRFREWACSWTQDTYGIDCDDPDRVEWSSGGAVIDWGEDFVHGYAHVEVRVVMARHHASAEAPAPTRACCQARRRACAAAQSNASCT